MVVLVSYFWAGSTRHDPSAEGLFSFLLSDFLLFIFPICELFVIETVVVLPGLEPSTVYM